ncbi:NAD(P)H-dependent oxidoreductase [Bifidobacterium pullorum subsp. saeculare]|uniref:NAD(P)H-dependent oxidoreductase n=1 Tax=Bifidobacterium pullorum subsp. saeculare TaxID=78257 RepID=A0A938WWP5_9BIFI|nr:NAD(P)H-dependent oxidoreductase [Bifidobacterium pullorum]MBM6699236.1 NAD(P)H-dependent oxidoreductase [Bifidobacterium pullorum subsp. saeculare]
MATTVLVFHPHLADTSRVNARLLAELKASGASDVTVRDEYALYPDFRIDVKAEQAALERTDRIVLQFPFYWYSSPALLKQWEDEVFRPGWCYGGGHALDGKTLRLVVTTGSEAAKFQPDGAYKRTMDELLSPFEVVARRIGLTYEPPFLVQGCATIDEAGLDEVAKAYVKAIAG